MTVIVFLISPGTYSGASAHKNAMMDKARQYQVIMVYNACLTWSHSLQVEQAAELIKMQTASSGDKGTGLVQKKESW